MMNLFEDSPAHYEDSPTHSSSSEDLAAFLNAELSFDSIYDSDYDSDFERVKRQKVESQCLINLQSSSSQGKPANSLESSPKKDGCPHPGFYAGMCMKCVQKIDGKHGIALSYIHKDLRVSYDALADLHEQDLKSLLRRKKLYLVLDLDHTLLNSALLHDITAEEGYLNDQGDGFPDNLKTSLCRLDCFHMITKLRPHVHTFLKEASKLFEMLIYTMGERPYALEMAKLLDPEDIYFNSRIIAQDDSTRRHEKNLDIVGHERAVIILDDTEEVWRNNKDNLILMERYHFFASSCKHFPVNCKSLSELRRDESETGGSLATVLKILKQIYNLFFNEEREDNLEDRDVRQVLKTVRKQILKGCKIVFTRVFPTHIRAESHRLWIMAEQMGATCSTNVDPYVTHVVSMDLGTDKSRWAVKENKFLVHPNWIVASSYLWLKQPEENFHVTF